MTNLIGFLSLVVIAVLCAAALLSSRKTYSENGLQFIGLAIVGLMAIGRIARLMLWLDEINEQQMVAYLGVALYGIGTAAKVRLHASRRMQYARSRGQT